MVGVVGEGRIAGGGFVELGLSGNPGSVALAAGGDLLRTRRDVDAAAAAVIADAVLRTGVVVDVVHDDWAVVVVADVAGVGDGAVVVKVVTMPVAAEVADADVAEAVVNAAIEADVGAPVAAMEEVTVVVVPPVGRGPESAVVGRLDPGSGNPVIAVIAPGPVAGGPVPVGSRRRWLIVLGDGGRGLVGGVLGVGVVVVVVVVGGGLLRRVGLVLAEDAGGLSRGGGVAGGSGGHVGVGGIDAAGGVLLGDLGLVGVLIGLAGDDAEGDESGGGGEAEALEGFLERGHGDELLRDVEGMWPAELPDLPGKNTHGRARIE